MNLDILADQRKINHKSTRVKIGYRFYVMEKIIKDLVSIFKIFD